MYILYYAPGAASLAVHLTLLELGVPYELRKINLDARDQKQPEYLKLNPHGLVPTLVVDGAPMTECAAILMLLAERHPEAHLAPAPGERTRPRYLQWMLHLANTMQPAFRQWFYPQQFGPPEREQELKANAHERCAASWEVLDAHLRDHGPYILGGEPSVADLLATMLMRWSRFQPRQGIAWPALATLAARVKARPSWKRVYEVEGLTEW